MIRKEFDKKERWYEFLLKQDIPLIKRFILNKVYDRDFFEEGEKLKKDSAAKVAQIINDHLEFKSVFDIGCGMGIYLEEFQRLGKDVLGCEYSSDGLQLAPKDFTVFQADATKPIYLNRKYDLLVCFEVAEHIPRKHSSQLVRNCATNGEIVLFTAAPVGQGGVGHINEQPYEFWIRLFENEGYSLDTATTDSLMAEMTSNDVVWWLAKNIMCFIRK